MRVLAISAVLALVLLLTAPRSTSAATSAGVLSPRPCSAADVIARFSPCMAASATRAAFYEWALDCDASRATVTLPPSFALVDCDCVADDYEPTFSECDPLTGTRTLTRVRATDCTGAASLAPESRACACTDADLAGVYSPCQSGLREALFYWPDSLSLRCDSTDLPPAPPPVPFLPCEIGCAAGLFLPFASRECARCAPGSFSLGGATVVDDWPAALASGRFITRCGSVFRCARWTTSNDSLGHVTSGANAGLDNALSELSTSATFARNGSIAFLYKVDAEPSYDGLTFSIDGQVVLSLKSDAYEWTRFAAPVSAGLHTFVWTYSKDISVSVGADSASLAMVVLDGVVASVDACTACAPGSATDLPGASACTPCAGDTYAAARGATSCDPCPADEYSLPGAVQCTRRPTCTEADWARVAHGPCAPATGSQAVTYRWLEPKRCAGGLALPADAFEPCAACPRGSLRTAASGYLCAPCPLGLVANVTANRCEPCGPGQAARPLRVLALGDQCPLPDGLTSSCLGPCASIDGWRCRGSYIDSGLALSGLPYEASLLFQFEAGAPEAELTIDYELSCRTLTGAKCGARVFLDGAIKRQDAGTHARTAFTISRIAPGVHYLRVLFAKSDRLYEAPDAAMRVFSLTLAGATQVVGGDTCARCPAGSASAGSTSRCAPCPPGWIATATADACEPCPRNTAALSPSTGCTACGSGTTTEAGATACATNGCRFTAAPAVVYDLNALSVPGAAMAGPVWDDVRSRQKYSLSLCSRAHSNSSCVDVAGAPLDVFACQTTGSVPGVGVFQLGNVMGFEPLPNVTDGLVWLATNGDRGCGGRARSLRVTLLCDPRAGLGAPSRPDTGLIEASPCIYSLVWRSAYACPLCTAADYEPLVSECVDGTAERSFARRNSRCVAGVPAPPPQRVPCTGAARVCPPGTATAADGSDRCEGCPIGTASRGGSLVESRRWATLSRGVGAGSWTFNSDDEVAYRESSSAADLTVSVRYERAGSLSFALTAVCAAGEPLPPGPVVSFLRDGLALLALPERELPFGELAFTAPMSAGGHSLVWRAARGCTLALRNVTFERMYLAAAACSTCGSRPSEYSPRANATACASCPPNTRADGAPASRCVPCPVGTLRAAGEYDCHAPDACRASDFSYTRAPCLRAPPAAGPDAAPFQLIWESSSFCNATGEFASQQTVSCAACASHELLAPASDASDRMVCTACPPGQVLSEPSAVSPRACVTCPAGTYARRTVDLTHFIAVLNERGERELGGAGAAALTFSFARAAKRRVAAGWAWGVGAGASPESSGLALATVDDDSTGPVELAARVAFVIGDDGLAGSVAFDAVLEGALVPADGVLVFALDGVTVGTIEPSANGGDDARASTRVIRGLAPGPHTLTWTFVKRAGSGRAVIRALRVDGATGGSPSRCLPCPGGRFADESGLAECKLAPAGLYSPWPETPDVSGVIGAVVPLACDVANSVAPHPGAASCVACGVGFEAVPRAAATRCNNTCHFRWDDGTHYDLRDSGLARAAIETRVRDPTSGATVVWALSPCASAALDVCGGNASACRLVTGGQVSPGTVALARLDASQHYLPLSLTGLAWAGDDDRAGFAIEYRGDECVMGGASLGRPLVTTLVLLCAVDGVSDVGPTLAAESVDSPLSCSTAFVWRTTAACALCDAGDIETTTSACSDGTLTMTRRPSWPCRDASGEPVVRTESCSDVTVPVWALALAIGVLVVGAAVGGGVWLRTRRLETRYSVLMSNGAPPGPGDEPRDDLEDDDDDDDGAVGMQSIRE